MALYFCGLDQFSLVDNNQNQSDTKENSACINVLSKLNGYTNIQIRLGLVVFQKDSSWYIKGIGIPSVKVLFEPKHVVDEVRLAINKCIGFNKRDNILYKVTFQHDLDSETLNWNLKQVTQSDPSVNFLQIISNHETVYGLDDQSGIYEIDDSLHFKWRLEGIQVLKLDCGFAHFVAKSDTGALYSWGSGGRGELGHAEQEHVMVNCQEPKRIEFFDDLPCIVKDISCGGWHTLALTSDGDVYSWGWNESGQLGHSKDRLSTVSGMPYPIDLGSGNDPIAYISTGARHSVAILKSGNLFSWGLNKHGQLGLGDLKNRQEPVKVNFDNVKQLLCEQFCTLVQK